MLSFFHSAMAYWLSPPLSPPPLFPDMIYSPKRVSPAPQQSAALGKNGQQVSTEWQGESFIEITNKWHLFLLKVILSAMFLDVSSWGCLALIPCIGTQHPAGSAACFWKAKVSGCGSPGSATMPVLAQVQQSLAQMCPPAQGWAGTNTRGNVTCYCRGCTGPAIMMLGQITAMPGTSDAFFYILTSQIPVVEELVVL